MKHFSKFFSEYHLPLSSEKAVQNQRKKHTLSNEKIDNELNKINAFIRSGLFVLSAILISSIAIAYGQKNLMTNYTSTSGNRISNKKLPIYCVEQNEKKVALSFDAAWGNEDTAKILEILKKKKIMSPFL